MLIVITSDITARCVVAGQLLPDVAVDSKRCDERLLL